MNFEYGMRGFAFSIFASICLVLTYILPIILGISGVSKFLTGIGFSIAVVVIAFLAIVNGTDEIAIDSGNKKAKIGRRIGIALVFIEMFLKSGVGF